MTQQAELATVASIAHLSSPAALAESMQYGHAAGPFARRPHLDLINDLLVDAAFGRLPEGNGRYLIVNIMPQSGKSTLICQWFPVWVNELVARGVLPPGMFGLGTYEGTLARSWGRLTREAIVHNADLLSCRVSGGSEKMDEWETVQRGGMIARGVGGAFTGRPSRRMVVDDPNKAETIQSKTERDNVWNWWMGVGSQRLHPTAPVIASQARLHEDDFTGRLLSTDYEGDPKDWMVVRIPSIAEEETQPDPLGRQLGEPLYRPDWEPDKKKMIAFISDKEREVGSYRATGQYRQRPTSAGGKLFKRAKFQYWEHAGSLENRTGIYLLTRPDKMDEQGQFLKRKVRMRSCVRFATVDLATSLDQTADYTTAGLWDLTPYWELLLVDVIRDRIEGPDQIALLKQVHIKWRPTFIGIEKVGYQLSAVQHARRQGVPVKELKAESDKWTRALTAEARLSDNQVYFPRAADWLAAFEKELTDFPTGTHDDQVDMFSYAAIASDDFAVNAGWSKS